MKRLFLFLASIVVSLIVWAFTFNVFFDSSKTTFSLVIAIGIGVVIAGAIYAFSKDKLTAIFATISILAVAVISGILLFTASKFTPPRVCREPDPTVEINCSRPISVDDNKPCLNQGQTITWTLKQSDFTFKIHEFKSTRFGRPWKDDQPLDDDSFTGGHNNPAKGVARDDKHGVFKYSITCFPPSGSSYTKDPMIDIPKP